MREEADTPRAFITIITVNAAIFTSTLFRLFSENHTFCWEHAKVNIVLYVHILIRVMKVYAASYTKNDHSRF